MERAFVHVDYSHRTEPEHKARGAAGLETPGLCPRGLSVASARGLAHQAASAHALVCVSRQAEPPGPAAAQLCVPSVTGHGALQVDRNLASRSTNLFAAHASTVGSGASLLGAGSSLERAPGPAAAITSPSAPATLSDARANGRQ